MTDELDLAPAEGFVSDDVRAGSSDPDAMPLYATGSALWRVGGPARASSSAV